MLKVRTCAQARNELHEIINVLGPGHPMNGSINMEKLVDILVKNDSFLPTCMCFRFRRAKRELMRLLANNGAYYHENWIITVNHNRQGILVVTSAYPMPNLEDQITQFANRYHREG